MGRGQGGGSATGLSKAHEARRPSGIDGQNRVGVLFAAEFQAAAGRMIILYELLGNVLTAIEPRNERARTWLDKLILRCYTNSKLELSPIEQKALVQTFRFEFGVVRDIQGSDLKQKELYDQVEHLLQQLEFSTANVV